MRPSVFPAKAGIQKFLIPWIPARAAIASLVGMTARLLFGTRYSTRTYVLESVKM
jgi:hypothetical protein